MYDIPFFAVPVQQIINDSTCTEEQRSLELDPDVLNSYVAVMDQDDFSETLLESMDNSDLLESPETLQNVLKNLSRQIVNDKVTEFNINRSSVVECALRAFKRKRFDPKNRINVIFADDDNSVEGAIDAGGPTREFLRLFMKAIIDSIAFEGSSCARHISINPSAKMEKLYFYAGLGISLSLVHGGSAPKYISPTLFECICTEDISSLDIPVSAIGHTEFYERVLAIKKAENLCDLQEAAEKLSDIRLLAGCYRPCLDITEKERIVKDLVNFIVVGRVSENIREFKKGLETLNVLKMINENPQLFRDLFLYDHQIIDRKYINSIFKTFETSEPGSNRYNVELKIKTFWREFLVDVEEGETVLCFEDILVFATGADQEPPMGFNPVPTIAFLHENYRETNKPSMFPMANTCGLTLHLPVVHEKYQQFCNAMVEGIKGSPSFGQP